MPKDTKSSHEYDTKNRKLIVTVTVGARPADYETLHASATMEFACDAADVEAQLTKADKVLRNVTNTSIEKQVNHYDVGVAATIRKAKKSK